MRTIKNINVINHNSSFFGEIHINNVIEKVIKLNYELDLNADYLLPGFVDGHTHEDVV